ncbi:MAG: putative hemolysin [Cellvibrionaceae bacterium]|jgi:putative hemolysin
MLQISERFWFKYMSLSALLTVLFIVAVIVLLVGFNALYVAAEFATVASRKTRIAHLADEGNTFAKQLLPVMNDPAALDNYVATSQIGITISSLVLGIFGEKVIAEALVDVSSLISYGLAFTLTLILTTTLQVVLGELVPKSLSIQYPETIAMYLLVPMRISSTILTPLLWLCNGSANLLLRLFGLSHAGGHGHIHSPQEIEILVGESHIAGVLNNGEQELLRNAFRMRDLTARQVMIPRRRIVAAPADSTVQDLLALTVETGKSRIPLFDGDIDNIVGFVHVRDLFRLHVKEITVLPEKLRPIVLIPEAMPVSDVWDKLDDAGQYFGIVFDEFGGTYGLITLEDLIEEIFGELQDESDDEAALLYRGAYGRLQFRWDWLVADINEYFDLKLDETYDTLDALVIGFLGRSPEAKDEIVIDGTTIRVEKMGESGIEELSLVNPSYPKLGDEEVFKLFSQSVAGSGKIRKGGSK